MTFPEMPYARPDGEALKARIAELTEELKAADRYEEARSIFLQKDSAVRSFMTMGTLAQIRHTIDTRNEFYSAEQEYFDALVPELGEYSQAWTLALLQSPFRLRFEEEFGKLIFINAEIELKTFTPEIVPQLQEENSLWQEYQKLTASARIPFEGGVYTLSQLTPFKDDPDDARRLAAWQAEGRWYKDNQAELDRIYDKLTHLRDEMGRIMGYGGYTPLGYYRMSRNCYGKEDVEAFRSAVIKYLVPVADSIYRRQAQRLGKSYPLSFADAALEFRSGNPRPVGSAEDILAAGKKFYEELSPETGEFFNTMLDCKLMDLLSTEGKAGGGYCTEIPDYEYPFIFANFNGTQGDVEVVTHEAGHAFAYWLSRHRRPLELAWPGMESCEVHSMGMELIAHPWAESFFGPDTRKFLYSHLSSALTFIPYGSMVDHFQHIVYEKPEMSPEERHSVWKELLGLYMPWLKLDGEIPFYSEGMGWQRQLHIYGSPFYYIDYCLAQTVALQLWAIQQRDRSEAWDTYLRFTRPGCSLCFTELLDCAGLKSPFDEACLREVCATAKNWLDSFDLSGIE